jgi:long-chain fatty acid transport protein
VQFSESDPTRSSILNAGVDPKARDWQNTWSIGAGTAYDFNSHWTGRLGAGYLTTAVPEKSFEPSLPDSDRTEATAGLTYTWNKTQFHLAYNAAYFNTRSVSNNVEGGTINGTYRTFVNSWSVGVEERF